MKLKYLLLLLFVFCNLHVYAESALAQYAQAQIYEISPDIACIHEKHKIICNIENVEWIEGIIVKKMQYVLEMKDTTLLEHRYFELYTQNLNFEGYNLTALMPTSILCTEQSNFLQGNAKANTHNSIPTHIECTIQSNVYHIVIHANFTTSHPMYEYAKDILEARMAEYERFKQPIQNQNDEIWQKDYQIAIQNATIWVKSITLNQVLFDLYRREQRIAATETPQNDRDYRTIQDSTLTKDYMQFLQKSYNMLNTLNQQAHMPQRKQQILTKALHKFIAMATKPNQSFSLVIEGDKNLVLSLYELESLTAIDSTFFDVIIKILEHAHIKVA